MNFEELKSRDIQELRILAAQYGIKTHHRAKAESVAKLIVEHITKPAATQQEVMKHTAERPAKPPLLINTEEQVREVIALLLKKEGFLAQFPGDDTWIFRYRGAEESGHLSVPLRWIKIKAENVARGARLPRAIKDQMHGGASDLVMMV